MNKRDLEVCARVAKSGNADAYELLLLEVRDRARYVAKGKGIPAADIEDLSQNLLISFHLAFPSYDSAKEFSPWLNTLIRRRCADYFRKHYRSTKQFSNQGSGQLYGQSPSDTLEKYEKSEEQRELAGDERLIIEEAFKNLPARSRSVLASILRDGKSVDDTANELELSSSNVRVILHRAIGKIKKYILE